MTRWIVGVIVVAVIAIVGIVVMPACSGSDDQAGATIAGPDPEQMEAFQRLPRRARRRTPRASANAKRGRRRDTTRGWARAAGAEPG